MDPFKSEGVMPGNNGVVLPCHQYLYHPNSELGFSMIEMRDFFGLLILGEFYEEFVPLNSILERETE